MNLVIDNIEWDTDGKRIPTGHLRQGKQLPKVVLVLDAPDLSEATKDRLTDLLSDWFDFCHFGFHVQPTSEYANLTMAVDAIETFKE